MKNMLSAFIGLSIPMLISHAVASECSVDMLMTAERIGSVKLGMNEEEIVKLAQHGEINVERKFYYSEEAGADNLDYVVTVCERAKVTAYFYSEDVVYSLETESPKFSTIEGARVGMTAADLKSIYKNGLNINFWNEGVHRNFIVDDGKLGVFAFGKGHCELSPEDYGVVSSSCNEILPDDVSVLYWTNAAYTKPGVWD